MIKFKKISVALVCGLFLISSLVVAKIDLTPVAVKFQKGLDDDVSMSYSQHVLIYVKNVGNQVVKTRVRVKLSINGVNYRGYLYAPDNSGGALGGAIAVGQSGKIFLRLPLGRLKHCQALNIKIDTDRRLQHGFNVFNNDYKNLSARDRFQNRFCFKIPIKVKPPIAFPLPRVIIMH